MIRQMVAGLICSWNAKIPSISAALTPITATIDTTIGPSSALEKPTGLGSVSHRRAAHGLVDQPAGQAHQHPLGSC